MTRKKEKVVASSLPGEAEKETPEPVPDKIIFPAEPQGPTPEERIAKLEETQAKILEGLSKLPNDLQAAFQSYDEKLRASLPKSGGGIGDLISPLLASLGSTGNTGGGDPFTAEITNMTREIVSISLRGALNDMRKRFGMGDHVTATHG